MKHYILPFLLLSALAGTVRGQSLDPEVREQFLVIERIARLPYDQRAAEVPRLYRETLPPMTLAVANEATTGSTGLPAKVLTRDKAFANGNEAYGQELESTVAKMTPEQVADTIGSNYGSAILRRASLRRLEFVLLKYRSQLDNLITQDLANSDPEASHCAFIAVGEMHLREFIEKVTAILVAGGPRDADARYAIGWIRSDPVAAKPILADLKEHPVAIERYYPVLRVMLFHEPPDPVLLTLAQSGDAATRRWTAVVLEETDANSAIDLVPKLTNDSDSEVRQAGMRMAFHLPDELFGKVRASVLPGLASPALDERIRTAAALAGKHDAIAAPVLLDAMKNVDLPTELRGTVAIGVNRLVMARVPVRFDMDSWGPESPANAQAIGQLEQWIASQQKNGAQSRAE